MKRLKTNFANYLAYSKSLSLLRTLLKNILASVYPLVDLMYRMPKVESIPKTLRILSDGYSIVRFGDGEFLYLVDKRSLPFQKYDHKLADYFREILKNNNDGLMVGLPSGYHSFENLNSVKFWKSQMVWTYPKLRRFLDLDSLYYNASISRLYIEYIDKSHCGEWFENFKSIWYEKDILMVEGDLSRVGVGNDLFSEAKSVKRILCPHHNAFERFDEILDSIEEKCGNRLVLVSLGPCAKAIVYELYRKGIRAIDLGNLDIEYEWFLAGVTKKIKIDGKYTSEAKGGRDVSTSADKIYESEIINQIK